jgi:adenylate kinase family enzyme
MVLFVCGVPAAGKSTFARHLVNAHQFMHYDLEVYPSGWPDPSLKPTWDASRSAFVASVVGRHGNVVLDWGFHPQVLDWVRQLASAGCLVLWFAGTRTHATVAYTRRATGTTQDFVNQMRRIEDAGLPGSLPEGSIVVDAFDESGHQRDPHSLCLKYGAAWLSA